MRPPLNPDDYSPGRRSWRGLPPVKEEVANWKRWSEIAYNSLRIDFRSPCRSQILVPALIELMQNRYYLRCEGWQMR